jgi:SPP1 family predicted phage head-tail adaptor
MKSGTPNKRATFRSLVTVSDGAGGSTLSWQDYVTVWAQLSPERAREKIQQGRIADASAGVLRVRSSTATRLIDGTYKVVVDGMTFNVRGASNPDQRNDMLEFIVETDGTQAGS